MNRHIKEFLEGYIIKNNLKELGIVIRGYIYYKNYIEAIHLYNTDLNNSLNNKSIDTIYEINRNCTSYEDIFDYNNLSEIWTRR